MANPESLIDPDGIRFMVQLAAGTPLRGSFVEVGVYRGGSAVHLYDKAVDQGRRIFLCDTWTGIPEKTETVDTHVVGDFAAPESLMVLQRRCPFASFFVGDFRLVQREAVQSMAPVSFVHVDVDQYRSTRAVIALLRPHMVAGGIMFFDDYKCLDGATKAIEESLPPHQFMFSPAGKAYIKFPC